MTVASSENIEPDLERFRVALRSMGTTIEGFMKALEIRINQEIEPSLKEAFRDATDAEDHDDAALVELAKDRWIFHRVQWYQCIVRARFYRSLLRDLADVETVCEMNMVQNSIVPQLHELVIEFGGDLDDPAEETDFKMTDIAATASRFNATLKAAKARIMESNERRSRHTGVMEPHDLEYHNLKVDPLDVEAHKAEEEFDKQLANRPTNAEKPSEE